MFRRKPDDRQARIERLTRTVSNQDDQIRSLHDQLLAASKEFERRYAEMQRDRDYWRRQAGALEAEASRD